MSPSPDDVKAGLEALGIHISRNTLQRWTRGRCLPDPETGSHGRGKGRYTEYPPGTVAEAAATWYTLRCPGTRPSLSTVAAARRFALDLHEAMTKSPDAENQYWRDMAADAGLRLYVVWLVAWRKALDGWPLEKPAKVIYDWTTTGTPSGGDFREEFNGVKLVASEEDRVSLGRRRTDV